MRQDLQFAFRLMRKAPGFTLVAMLTLALGIGASTAIFSQVDAVFWKPLPVHRPDELRSLVWSARAPAFVGGRNVIAGPAVEGVPTYGSFSYPAYKAMRDGATTFSNLACWSDLGEARPVVMRDVGFGSVHFVSGNFFETLGVAAALGRTFTDVDDAPGAHVAVLSDAFWRRAFGARTDVVRETIDLNGASFAIVGVTPGGFFGVDSSVIPDVFVPTGAIQIAAATANPRDNPVLWQFCRVVGRVRSGVSDAQLRGDVEPWLRNAAEAATAALATMAQRPAPVDWERPRLWVLDAARGAGTLRSAMSMPLAILMAVVIGTLLIACANIAGLLIVRGSAREREIATRLALGASRSRLIRQLLTESVVLSTAGGAAGVAAAAALGRLSPAFMSRFMPPLFGVNRQLGVPVTPDWRVLVFSTAVVFVTGVMFGCVPALRAARTPLAASTRQSIGRRRRHAWLPANKALVAFQTALSLLLIVGAASFLRTIANIRATPLGYDPGGLLYARIEPRTGGIRQAQRADFFERALQRLERLPGVESVTATDAPPLGRAATIFNGTDSANVCAPGFVVANPQDARAAFAAVEPRYFATLGIRLVAGRELTWADKPRDDEFWPPVMVVNEAFARKFFAGRNPLEGRFGLNCPAAPAEYQVIGVVADNRTAPREQAGPMFFPFMGGTLNVVTLILRTRGRPEALIPTVRRAMNELNAHVPTFAETTPVELREQQMQQERLLTILLLAFAATALLLSSIGIYGMLAYLVNRRTSEIGVRMALGAGRRAILAMVLGESIAPVAVGLVAGAAATFAAARWVESLLFGVSPHDPWTLTLAAGVFLLIAALAAVLPARRATRIDPLRALRVE